MGTSGAVGALCSVVCSVIRNLYRRGGYKDAGASCPQKERGARPQGRLKRSVRVEIWPFSLAGARRRSMLFKMIRRPRQQSFEFTRWGGQRKGAGRPRKDGRADKGVPHLPRAVLAARFPVLATWRMAEGVWNLRSRRSFRASAPGVYAGAEREGFRLVHYAILGNHIHLLVEASDRVR